MLPRIKSPDYAAHGAITGPLTNRRIDHYKLTGFYGEHERTYILSRIRSGKCRAFDKKILAGQYGADAIRALKSRVPREKRKPVTSPTDGMSQEELNAFCLELLGVQV